MGKSKNPVVRLKVKEQQCGLDKKQRYFTRVNRASVIGDDLLIEYASNDSGIRIEQIASVYRSLMTQVKQLVCNGHSVQLGDMGTLYFKIHARVSEELEGAGGGAVKSKRIGFRASKAMRQLMAGVNFVTD
jgi:nucleoid DNA-binding protein